MSKFIKYLEKENFIEDYWEQKPIVIRNLFEINELDINREELIEMAGDEYFESRLIYEEDGNRKLKEGPVSSEEIKKHKFSTLFVHNLNLYNQTALNLEKAFEFIPKYLFDDVMCSISTKGAGVGAHIDPYNVFIIQVKGLREWSLQMEPIVEWDEKSDTKVLKTFNSDQTFILNPGDMLYVPPHVAHQGISLEDSVSLSIGFNSFESKNLIDQFLDAASLSEENHLYQNSQTTLKPADTYMASEEFIEDLKDIIKERVNDQSIENWILGYLTYPKKHIHPNEDVMTLEEFIDKTTTQKLCFDEFSKMIAYQKNDHFIISLNSELASLDKKQYEIFSNLFQNKHIPFYYEASDLDEFMFSLYQKGVIFFTEEES